MRTALVTGGSGFFGGILKRQLLERGWSVINIDLVKDDDQYPQLTSIQGDIRNGQLLLDSTRDRKVDVIFHCAAILAHAVKDTKFLWSSNVDGTRSVIEFAKASTISKVIFISSNCLWGENFGRPIREEDTPKPVEIYGQSKWEGEKILINERGTTDTVIFRCPTITDAGRLGLLAILFEFIDEGRKVWTVGGGYNRYQFIYAGDLVEACIKAVDYPGTALFNIGSDNVKMFREVYQEVIDRAQSGSRVASLPKGLTLFGMKLMYWLGLSPLGPYQYKMIAEDFEFDTSKIKRELGWMPTLTNGEMLWKAYEYYRDHRKDLKGGEGVSAHRQPAKMGVIRILKWLS
ncbi:NAD(P)-dependent oxidoreductase [Candidatus Peribacteria bacterium]|nr:NAD(P)-dependent oxidoreductase [Candidatus Peribacteria bacterium]